MFTRAAVVSDLSNESFQLVECLEGLREIGTREIILAHALGIKHIEAMKYELARLAEPVLLEQKRLLESKGFTVKIEIATGLPNPEINQIAEREEASYIVVAVHTTNILSETFFGGPAAEIIYSAQKPVLVVRPQNIEKNLKEKCVKICGGLSKNILYTTDFSDNSERAFEYLEQLVATGCKKITLLHVQDKVRIEKYLEHKLDEFNQIDKERLERLQLALLSKGATDVSIEIPYGSPTSEILQRAKSGLYSLIVMGSQGRGFIPEIFLGSVSHNIARHAPVPVLLVPALR
jgi:nucleotide-binding universal stress UspA family protein